MLFRILTVTYLILLSFSVVAEEFEASVKLGLESRYFFESGQSSSQLSSSQTSLAVEPELYWGWNEGNDSVTFKPFFRIDSEDDERTHGDVREFSYIHVRDDWELRAGIRKEFWGVTEFQHLVDIINQTDNADNINGEEKLGQLMLNLSLVEHWGIVDLYVLPGFRERTFPGEDGRLRAPLTVDSNKVGYESNKEEDHVDLAIRWTHTFGYMDIGAHWFRGTNREPQLIPTQVGETLQLRQYYNQIAQFGVDVQANVGDWLLKLESIHRESQTEAFDALQAGFEYTYFGVFDTNLNVGLLAEYSWDSRGEESVTVPGTIFQNDMFLGCRIAFNDVHSSSVLVGVSTDLDHDSSAVLVEASRRLGESFTVNVDLRLFQSTAPADPLFSLRSDDFVNLNLNWYF
ncbi:MAG: hypothetical protein ACI9Y1_000357 [Lentisphaeria bacterium]|jgi:hypothetical protein